MSLSIIQWNCRSVLNKITWLTTDRFFQGADILVLQETWLAPTNFFNIPSRSCFHLYRPDGQRGQGLTIAVSTNIPARQISSVFLSQNLSTLRVDVFPQNRRIAIVNLYCRDGLISSQDLNNVIRNLPPNFVLLGDFNCHHPFWGSSHSSPGGIILANWIADNDLLLLNTGNPTWYRGTAFSCIDLSIASISLGSTITWTTHSDLYDSDHVPIVLQLGVPRNPHPILKPHMCWKSFKEDINTKFQSLSLPTPPEALIPLFSNSISTHTKLQSFSARAKTPWWTSRCRFLLGQKRRFLRLAKRTLSSLYWSHYKHAAALLRREIRCAKRTFWCDFNIRVARPDSFFRIFKKLQEKFSSSNTLAGPHQSQLILMLDNIEITDKYTQARHFVDHFTSTDFLPPIPLDFSGSSMTTWLDDPFTIQELMSAIKRSPDTSPGYDGITIKMIKNLSASNLERLLSVYNISFNSGSIPSDWKTSLIVPILKRGKPGHMIDSYRPIAMTSVICKIMERMILNRLLHLFFSSQFFHPNQMGFLPRRSCIDALLQIQHKIFRAKKEKTLCISFKIRY